MTINVLVVENDDDVRHLLGVRLQKRGYQIVTAETGTAAIEAAQAKPMDVVITELLLPDMDGLSIVVRRGSSI